MAYRDPEKYAAARQRVYRKKLDIIQAFRNERGCEECGERHPAVLDLHHREGETKNPRLAAPRGWTHLSYEDIKAEFLKCSVLCSNCHRIATAKARARGG